MSRPNSAIKTKNFIKPTIHKSQGNLIIIQKERLGSAKSKKSVMIIDKGNYKVQYDIDQNINKEKIDKTVKDIEKKVLTISNNYNNTNKITNIENTEVLKLKVNNDSFNNEKENNFNTKTIDDKNHESNKELINSDSSNNDDKEKRTEIVNNINQQDIKINNKEKESENENEKEDEDINEYNYNDNNTYAERKLLIFHSNSFNDNLIDESYLSCYICDRTYSSNRLYSADCNKHFICRRCCKNYYEERIEQGDRDLKCSVFTCNESFNPGLSILQKFLSENHLDLLLNNKTKNNENKLIEPSLSLQKKYNFTNQSSEVMKSYMKKHVIDINSNQNFYMYNKAKVQFCPKCGEQSLFSKTGTYFVKCLNCFHRICKYCMKEYNELHMDISNDNHCKIYYRRDGLDDEKKSFFYLFLIEIFLIISAFIFLFVGAFNYFKNCIKAIFCIKQYEDYGCFKTMIINFVTLILFFMSFPILLISFPYFSVFNSIFGF